MVAVVVQGEPATTLGLKVAFKQPYIGQATLKETGLLKPLCGVTVSVYDGVDDPVCA
jgi:hypothetical protein